MNTATANGSAVDDLLEFGQSWIAKGWPIIPCNGKVPCDDRGFAMDDWQKAPISVERLRAGLRNAAEPAIGLRMGPASGIIDIETDDDSEVEAVRHLFRDCEKPISVAYSSRRGRHDWYQYDPRLEVIGKAVFKYKAPGGSVKIRLGLNDAGAQSVIPPSAQRSWLPGLSPDDVNVEPLPDVVVQRLLTAAAATAPAPRANDTTGVHANALAAMLASTKNQQDGEDGSKRLFTCACRLVEHNATDAEAVATTRAYAAQRPFPKQWTDAEILQRIRDAEKATTRGSAVVIANYSEIEVEVETDKLLSDGSAGEGETETETIVVPKPLPEIIADINKLTNNWPRRVGGVLFVDDPTHGLSYFDKRGPAGLFGYLRRRSQVDWRSGGKFTGQAELFAEIERTATPYDSIEEMPHEPSIAGIYYRGRAPKPGDGSHLRWLLDRFRPETTIDRDLIQAALMTAAWGGPAGRRPMFVPTSDHGRGVGKTTVAELAGRLFGGVFDVSAGEDIEKLKTRLLTPSAFTKRVALLDNVKSLRLSWAELESLITAPVISGRQLYSGEAQRPNLLTWFCTLNGVSLATDLAQRSVIIKLVRGDNAAGWYEETTAYIDQHRDQIIGDIIAALRSEPHPLASYSRWATWEKDVLCRLPEPAEAQKVILERQGEANCELDEAEIIEQHFAEQLATLGYAPDTAQVRIPVATAAEWFCKAVGEPMKVNAVSRRLNQMAGEQSIKRIAPDPSRSHGRCFIWTGDSADVLHDAIANDLGQRIKAGSSLYPSYHNGRH